MPFNSALVVFANWLALAMAGGLIFVALIQPGRQLVNYVFVLFCASLGLWSLTSMMGLFSALRFGLNEITIFYLGITSIALTAASFFYFVIEFTKHHSVWARRLLRALPVIFIISMVLVWGGYSFQDIVFEDGLGLVGVSVTPIGYGALGIALAYLITTLWLILDSVDERTKYLRIPAVLLIVGYAANIFEAFQLLPIDTLLSTAAAVWVGWQVLHFQTFNPLVELNKELNIANRDLKQVVNDLATEKNRAEQLYNELQAASQYKSQFLANMSHELRTPLNSIIGYSELLRGNVYGELNEKQRDRLNKIYGNGKHLLELINDILDYNKIEAGRLKLDIIAFKPGLMIDQVVTDIEPLCTQKGLKLNVNIGDNLTMIYGDQNRIRQILDNVLDNAVKFTPSGSITLDVSIISVIKGSSPNFKLPTVGWLRDGEWIVFTIIDTGIGIDPEDQAKIFDQFSQVDTSRTREYEGTGLGLAITKRLVEMHGGTIWLKSASGEGSTFYIALPTEAKPISASTRVKTEQV